MPNNLEEYFRAEVKRRRRGSWALGVALLSLGWILHQCSSGSFINEAAYHNELPSKIIYKSSPIALPLKSKYQAMPRQQEIIHESSPIALPPTGVMKKPSVRTNIFGQLRVFLRAPLSNEKSNLPAICPINPSFSGITHNTNYFIEVINWQSDKVTTTAFVRASDIVKILIPFGTYKLRYAIGNQWYGEKKLFEADKFGSDDIYEMTEPYSSKTAKFEFNAEHPGIDIGAYCFHGNLSKKRVRRVSH